MTHSLACPRKIAAAIAFEVALRVACHPQCLYDVTTILAAVSVVSPIEVLLSC